MPLPNFYQKISKNLVTALDKIKNLYYNIIVKKRKEMKKMKISVAYQINKDIEIEIDDQYRTQLQEPTSIKNQNKWVAFGEALDKVYEFLPVDAEIISIYNAETDEPIFES